MCVFLAQDIHINQFPAPLLLLPFSLSLLLTDMLIFFIYSFNNFQDFMVDMVVLSSEAEAL
jgi:hypothetical protein